MNRHVHVGRRVRLTPFLVLAIAACAPVAACSSSSDGDSGSSSGDPALDGSVVQDTDGGGSTRVDGGAGDGGKAKECGRLTTKCKTGEACEGAPDCESGVCREGTCRDVSPSNGVKDGDETDVDCGGSQAPACADGKGCAIAADCTSGVCTGNVCQVPTANDGVKNGDETGVDCGGSSGKGCATGEGCKSDQDCDAVKCDLGSNKCAAATNSDGFKNGDETDVDCGGATAPKCAEGKACLVDTDCAGNVRCDDGAKTCSPPSNADGLKNGTETDVDCGGGAPTNAPKCAGGKACLVAGDCVDDECTGNVCVAPANNDGKKNGNESDVDCGSSGPGTDTNAPPCDAGKLCAADDDCMSGGCNHKGVCAAARSCVTQHGGTTCGTGDSSRPGNQNEDCCLSEVVPANVVGGNAQFRLDKYQITSGRMRRFLDAVNGNVQLWVQQNRANIVAPTQLPPADDKYLPTGWTQPNSNDDCRPDGTGANDPVIKCNYGALNHVNGYRYNNDPGGDYGFGCYMGPGSYGSRTFWMTAAESAHTGEIQHSVSRDRVEQKAMVCGTYYIYAAFCAWDGGRLETYAEYNAAYGTGLYPWPDAPNDQTKRALGFTDLLSPTTWPLPNVNVFEALAGDRPTLLTRINRANFAWNYYNAQILDYRAPLENRATNPIAAENNINIANDQSVAVAPPGRYPAGAGAYGHRDLLGNTMEITATVVNTNRREWARNGSFETSHFNTGNMTGVSTYNFPPLTKYGRSGARCARPISGYPAQPLPAAPQ